MKNWLKLLVLLVSFLSLAGCIGGGDDTEASKENNSDGTTVSGFNESGTLRYAVYELDRNTVQLSHAIATVEASGLNGTVTFGEDFVTTTDACGCLG